MGLIALLIRNVLQRRQELARPAGGDVVRELGRLIDSARVQAQWLDSARVNKEQSPSSNNRS